LGEGPVFKAEYRVYWSETDAAGIMHFSNYLRACERAEEDYIRSLGFRYGRGDPITFPRVHAECDYQSPLYPGEDYTVSIVNVKLGRSSIRYEFEVHGDGGKRLAAKCVIVAVAYDNREGKAVPIPDEIRKAITSSLGSKP